jgi:hypothetical protein
MSKSRKPLQKPIDHVAQHRILREPWQKIQENTDGAWLGDNAKANLNILDSGIEIGRLCLT